MLKKLSLLSLVCAALAVSSCSYQKNNRIDQDDVNAGNERIYGVHPDSTARQLKLEYTSKPELGAKAVEIREKWFN